MTTQREPDAQFETFLNYLSGSRNFYFTAYKRPSLARRVRKRMEAVGITEYADYTDYLEVHPDEFTELFNTILINVTGFFRDPLAWERLREEIVPQILAGKQPGDPIRIWSAGCASGEEAYSLAMMLAEALPADEMRRSVKIYATDVDEDALNTARAARYRQRDLAAVPEDLREKYFEPNGDDKLTFRADLRRCVIFGRHDLLNDAPISRIDLLVCRNTLMYLNPEAQRRVLGRFFFALNNGGFLFLGKAETLLTYTSALTPVDLKLRIFTKTARGNVRDRYAPLTDVNGEHALPVDTPQDRMRELAFEVDPLAQITIDGDGAVALVNARARLLFGISIKDLGRPLQDLEVSYRPAELRSLIEQAYTERRTVTLREVEINNEAAGRAWMDISVIPLSDIGERVLGAKLLFNEITRFKEMQESLQQARNELETAYEELQSSNEELETTNEELQSTVEELETTNEELQSTNEELETMNEELQSTNEELETVNAEMQDRGRELGDANLFLESILTSLDAAVIVVNRELAVQAWNGKAEEVWGLRSEEVRGKHFLNLDIGLPVTALGKPIRDCLANKTHERLTLDAVNRRGREIKCDVTLMPLVAGDAEPAGVILVINEAS